MALPPCLTYRIWMDRARARIGPIEKDGKKSRTGMMVKIRPKLNMTPNRWNVDAGIRKADLMQKVPEQYQVALAGNAPVDLSTATVHATMHAAYKEL